MIFPQICPCIIVGIFYEDKILVTRYNEAHKMIDNGKIFKPTVKDSLVAGYVEIGESFEDAVKREVMEEVGLKVKNIRYYQSAPWPSSSSILQSYLADVDGDPTICFDREELGEACWKKRDEIKIFANDFSLTGKILEDFRTGKI